VSIKIAAKIQIVRQHVILTKYPAD